MPKKPKPKAKPKLLTVKQAADVMMMTPGGVYAAILDNRLPATRTKEGRRVRVRVLKSDAQKFLRDKIAWYKAEAARQERLRTGKLTDEEFIQRMWDNDPD